ncbi:MAG: NfeD family protein [Alphaproteobacteria bacterium]|jgi:membrane protein implicated in regulation of membrane protease activity
MLGGAFETVVYWHWLALAGIFAGLEILAPGVFLIFPGIAAVVVGVTILLLPELDWRLQLLLFAVLAVAFIFIGRRIYGRISESEDHHSLNRRADRLIGDVYPLTSGMTGGRGKVRVGDTDWLARLEGGKTDDIAEGAAMRVVAIEGATLLVAPKE